MINTTMISNYKLLHYISLLTAILYFKFRIFLESISDIKKNFISQDKCNKF